MIYPVTFILADFSAQHVLLDSQSCLVTRLVTELAEIKDWHKLMLVVPTQRFGTYLMAALAQVKSAFRPPRLLTLEQFMQLAQPVGGAAVLDDASLDIVIASCIKSEDFRHLQVAHARELRLLFTELEDEASGPEAFDRLEESLLGDVHKSTGHLEHLVARVKEIQRVHAAVHQLLEGQGWQTRGAMRRQAGDVMLGKLADGFDFGVNALVFAGFTSVQKSWHPVLRALAEREDTRFFLSRPPEQYGVASPLSALIEALRPHGKWQEEPAAASPARRVQVIEAPQPLAECRFVLQSAARLIAEGLAAPHEIAVIVTSEGQYGPMLKTLAKGEDFEVNLALPFNLASTAPGMWLDQLASAVQADAGKLEVFHWLLHPLTLAFLIKAGGEKRSVHEAREVIVGAFGADFNRCDASALCHQISIADLRAPAVALVTEIEELRASRDQAMPLNAWLEKLESLVGRFAITHWEAESADVTSAVREGLKELWRALSGLAAAPLQTFSGEEFWQLVSQRLREIEVRRTGEPLSGVQVIGLPEARYIPFRIAMVVGCYEGSFPKGLPRDDLLDDWLKRQMGLPGWHMLEAMEDVTFNLLRARLPNLVLLRPRQAGQEITVRSRFIEKLVSENLADEKSLNFEIPAAGIMPEKRPLEGATALDEAESELSATALSSLLKCPYRFLLEKLRLREADLPSDQPDLRLEGEWLHAVVEAFFTGHAGGRRLIDDWPMPMTVELFDAAAMGRILALTKLLGPDGIEDEPLYHQLRLRSWPQFIAHVRRLYHPDDWALFAHSRQEWAFGMAAPLRVPLAGRDRGVRGSIDSVMSLRDLTVVTDFKRSYASSKGDVESGLAPQLPFYGLALKAQEGQGRRVYGYFNLLDGKWEPRLMDEEAETLAKARGLVGKGRTPAFEEAVHNLEDLVSWREDTIAITGRFYADPSDCGSCRLRNVCREREPGISERLHEQTYLSDRLNEKTGGKDDASR